VLDNLGGFELLGLMLVALFVIGPERLPKVIGDVLAALRKLRAMAQNATSDLSRELGTTIELEDLHPKTFLRKHLLSEAEEEALRKPFQDVYREVRGVADAVNVTEAVNVTDAINMDKPNGRAAKPDAAISPPPTPPPPRADHNYDDAT
jgi:sec-independent protein translocase protein TatB